MPPEEIRLWHENPRIKHLVAQLNSYPTQEDLLACITRVQQTAYRNLYRDIEKIGQLEPVFLQAADRQSDQIESAVVFEGNTRTAILKDLHERFPIDPRYARVKAYLLPLDFPDDQLAILMANYHVKGTLRNQWDRYQIGAFLYEQIEQKHRFNQAELAEYISKSQSWVSRHLTVYKFALEYKDEIESTHGLSPGEVETDVTQKFSLLEEAWKVKAFRDEMDRDVDAKETLFRWVYDGKFKDHRAIRGIYEIFTDPKRRTEVEDGARGSGDDAFIQLGKSIPLHDELDRLLRRIDGIQLGDLDSIDRRRVEKVRVALESLESTLERFARSV
jgi:hypothetical protein